MIENPAYIVELDKLPRGTHRYEFHIGDAWLKGVEKSELLGADVQVVAILNLRDSDFDLQIAAQGSVTVTCDRCLDPLRLEVNVEDDMDIEQGARTLDLCWLAYELIIVNLPLVHSHPEGECNALMSDLLHAHLCRAAEEPDTIG